MGKGKIEGWRIRSHRGSKTADHDCSKSPLVRLLGKETLEARWRPPWSQSPESILSFRLQPHCFRSPRVAYIFAFLVFRLPFSAIVLANVFLFTWRC